MNITLQSGILNVTKIVKPTKAKFFSEIREGDQIEITHTLRSTVGASGGGKYASYFTVISYTRLPRKITITGNELLNRLANFEVKSL